MIQTRGELRIGDLVQRGPNTKALRIVEVLHFTVKVIEHDEIPAQVEEWLELYYKEIQPIPLTEEWLLKFGFKNKGWVWALEKIPYSEIDWAIQFYKGEILLNYCEFYYTLCQGLGMKYVHQLQNLYYALTGEELTINENVTEP